MESVRVEINKTLSSLTSRSFCSSKQQICVQGPPGIQGRKGSRGRRGPRGVTGKKGTSGSRGKPGQRGKQGIMGPSGPKGEEGNMGAQGQKGEQGIMGSHGPKGNQGAMGKSGPKGNQGIMGPPGLKGKQGYMGPPGPKGSQGTMGPPGRKGEQGITGPPGTKGKRGIMGPKGGQGSIGAAGPRGIPGAKGKPGDSFQPPTLVISPMKHVITEKQSAVFQCSVGGNPKPTVTWLGKSGTPLRSMDGRLDVRHATFDDAGEYTCIGRNALGITSQTAFLTIIAVECTSYSSLTSGDRKTTFISKSYVCDKNLRGWYRFQGAAGTRMPSSCPPKERCKTAATGWLNGGHPTVADGKVTRRVCFHWESNCCHWSTNIEVRNCGSFYVYYFRWHTKV